MSGTQHFFSGWKTCPPIVTLLVLLLSSPPTWSADAGTSPANTPAAAENTAPANDKPLGRVARAVFTTAIVDREPVDDLTSLPNSVNRVYFFSDLRGLAGQIVTHRWIYNDKIMAEVTFKVGEGARWRVYSSKNLLPEWTGIWSVVVSNESGQVLHTGTLDYVAAEAAQ